MEAVDSNLITVVADVTGPMIKGKGRFLREALGEAAACLDIFSAAG